MTTSEPRHRPPPTLVSAVESRTQIGRPSRISRTMDTARTGARMLVARIPGTLTATRAGTRGSTRALQALPDSALRSLAAASVGLGAGLYLAGAPRVISAAGASPALLMGAAIVLRPIKPDAVGEPDR